MITVGIGSRGHSDDLDGTNSGAVLASFAQFDVDLDLAGHSTSNVL
jgi:hypothetical protein